MFKNAVFLMGKETGWSSRLNASKQKAILALNVIVVWTTRSN